MNSESTMPDREERPRTVSATHSPLRTWIMHHDDSWLFTIAYVGSAVLLSIWISLFWLLAVVGVHAVIEWIRHTLVQPRPNRLAWRIAWEIKLDIALVLFALALAVYMDVILGLAGLGAASRLGAQAAARGANAGARGLAWVRAMRGVLLSIDDVANVAARIAANRGRTDSEDRSDPDAPPEGDVEASPPWKHWGVGDHAAIWIGLLFLTLIAVAPLLLPDTSPTDVFFTISRELHPFPAD